MAATIKPIEAKSVHQIQAGQVIVDLCSVVKELVENALDAEATNIEVRFRNNGLDSIEVQDNGSGIAESNYPSIALKHYTSKLSTYDDLSSLRTFGFRGEALSSLCALSVFSIVTAQAHETPKGQKLEFEVSGKLKSTSLVAAQKGTIATVENLFEKLPVRRKELTKNIKREYGKVIGLLHAYACISTGVKFTVRSAMPKAKSAVVFATKGNVTTRDNIANVYGAKMLAQLIELNLSFEMEADSTQATNGGDTSNVRVQGHISRPVFGEGRQTPDRQMFFVNGRPCGLPQISKAINEVYKSYNVSQSPFIFADFILDTNAYDVNVSPDKRSIYLHNAALLIDKLKTSLTDLFDHAEQTIPQSGPQTHKLPGFKQLTVNRTDSAESNHSDISVSAEKSPNATLEAKNLKSSLQRDSPEETQEPSNLFHSHFNQITSTRPEEPSKMSDKDQKAYKRAKERQAQKIADALRKLDDKVHQNDNSYDEEEDTASEEAEDDSRRGIEVHVSDFNARMKEQEQRRFTHTEQEPNSQFDNLRADIPQHTQARTNEIGVVQNAFNHMRRRRLTPELATIKIGDRTITKMIGSQTSPSPQKSPKKIALHHNRHEHDTIASQFSRKLQKFDAEEGSVDEGEGDDSSKEGSPSKDEIRTTQDLVKDTSHLSADREGPQQTSKSHVAGETVEQVERDVNNSNSETDKADEESRVAELIRQAEASASHQDKASQRRITQALKGGQKKESTTSAVAIFNLSLSQVRQGADNLAQQDLWDSQKSTVSEVVLADEDHTDEEQLSLTVSKSDFSLMHIVGQFNLGFIIAVRPAANLDSKGSSTKERRDELFIIDQHASDEKYNFERFQADTTVGNQRLVHPVRLELTAVEEEIILENIAILEKNGFEIEIDTSGDEPIGERCKIVSLPLSKEVVFNTRDLEELIHLIDEAPTISGSSFVPRPSKVRRMFAMRACRSSIMIGKTLSKRQMSSVLQHMGEIDKPWNCPHGRPTMRHLRTLDILDSQLWREGDGVCSDSIRAKTEKSDTWAQYMS